LVLDNPADLASTEKEKNIQTAPQKEVYEFFILEGAENVQIIQDAYINIFCFTYVRV